MSVSAELERIKAEALKLSDRDKVRLAEDLYYSANGISDDGLDPEQRAELERRLEKVRNGAAKFVPWEEVRDRILKRSR